MFVYVCRVSPARKSKIGNSNRRQLLHIMCLSSFRVKIKGRDDNWNISCDLALSLVSVDAHL